MPAVPKGAELTAKQERFVVEYLVDHNATQAAIRAGYSPRTAKNTASDLLQMPRVKKAIAAAVLEQQRRTLITADQVLLDIQNWGNAAFKAKDYAQALRSRELLGKRFKLFTEKHEHTGADGAPLIPKKTDLTDDELAAIAAGRRG